MKNTIKNIRKSILMVALLTASLNYANETTSLEVKNEPVKKTVLTLKDVKKGNTLLIKDTNGFVLYNEMIIQNGTYAKGFDLSALPDGDYLFELNKDLEIKTKPFTVKSNSVEFNEALETTFYKPFIKSENGKIFVSKLNLDEAATDIKIYFENKAGISELIYSETIKNKKIIEKVFDVSAENGDYTVILKTKEKEFKNLITI
jgi:hypothetical protein